MKWKFLKIFMLLALVAPIGLTPILACACDTAVQNHDCCEGGANSAQNADSSSTGQGCCIENQSPKATDAILNNLQVTFFYDVIPMPPTADAKRSPPQISQITLLLDRYDPSPPNSIYLKNHSFLL